MNRGAVVLSLVLVLNLAGQAAPPVLKKEEAKKGPTRITEPVDKDGFVEYEAALNAWLGKGISSDRNANVLIWKALGPTPEGGEPLPKHFFNLLGMDLPDPQGKYFVSYGKFLKPENLSKEDFDAELQLYSLLRPWDEHDRPRVAAWLKANEAPLVLIAEAVKRPDYFNPLVSPRVDGRPTALLGCLLPAVQTSRELTRALTARAMLRLGNGDYPGAWQDLLTSHRLARLIGRGSTMIEALVGVAIEAMTIEADLVYLEHARLSSREIQDRLKELNSLPATTLMADHLDLGERCMFLDSLQLIRRDGGNALRGAIDGKKAEPPSVAQRLALSLIDWQGAIDVGNDYFDREVAALRLKTRPERLREIARLEQELVAVKKRFGEPEEMLKSMLGIGPKKNGVGTTIGQIMLALMAPALVQGQTAEDRGRQRIRNLNIALGLAAYHRDKGSYPASLKELVPKYLPEIPNDLFAERDLVYRLTDKGYLLYSVGDNGKDDAGRSYDDEPRGDDLVIKVPRVK